MDSDSALLGFFCVVFGAYYLLLLVLADLFEHTCVYLMLTM